MRAQIGWRRVLCLVALTPGTCRPAAAASRARWGRRQPGDSLVRAPAARTALGLATKGQLTSNSSKGSRSRRLAYWWCAWLCCCLLQHLSQVRGQGETKPAAMRGLSLRGRVRGGHCTVRAHLCLSQMICSFVKKAGSDRVFAAFGFIQTQGGLQLVISNDPPRLPASKQPQHTLQPPLSGPCCVPLVFRESNGWQGGMQLVMGLEHLWNACCLQQQGHRVQQLLAAAGAVITCGCLRNMQAGKAKPLKQPKKGPKEVCTNTPCSTLLAAVCAWAANAAD